MSSHDVIVESLARTGRGPGPRRALVSGGAALAVTLLPVAAWAGPMKEGPGAALLGILAVSALLAVVGAALGCLGHTVAHLFRGRTRATFVVLRAKPGWSLLAGLMVTICALGLLRVLRAAPPLQLVVLVVFVGFLAFFALAAATRLAAQLVDPSLLDEELPSLRVVVPAGLLLLALNAVPVLGTVLFVAIVLAALGATLLGYFVKAPKPAMAGAAAPEHAASEADPQGRAGPA